MLVLYGKELMGLEQKRVLTIGIVLVIALTLLACNMDTLTALVGPTTTPTPTRTPRPTFTPRPSATPEASPTPEATATAAASPTPTSRAAVTVRPATKAPTAPAPTRSPFIWRRRDNLDQQGMCPAGPGTFEVKGRIMQNNAYVGGIHIIALDSSGKVIAQMDSLYPEQMNPEWGVNCREAKNLFSYQLDVSAGRNSQPIIVRIVRSATDLTPISPDVAIQFGPEGGRYYLDWVSP
jgi:hypothetical protein